MLRYLKRECPAALISTLVDADVVALAVRKFLHRRIELIVRVANTMSHVSAHSRVKGRATLALWRRLLPSADAVVANSAGAAANLKGYVPALEHRVHTIHNPVVWPYIDEQAGAVPEHPWFSDAVPVVLSAGRLHPQKRHETTLRAFANVVKARAARLVILGEGPERDRLLGVARSLRIDHLVDFAGFQNNPFAYMARAAAFVLASDHEGLPNVLIQAMACGTPVVSTDCPSGPSEILEGGKWGELVPVGDWRALAAAILRTLDASIDRRALIARARVYDGEACVDRYMQLLEEVTGPCRHLR